MRFTPIFATALVTTVFVLAGLALASPWPQTRGWTLSAEARPATAERSWHRRHASHGGCDWSADEIQDHLGALRDRLNLSTAQAGDWATLENTIRDVAEAMRPDCRRAHESLAETDPVKMLGGIEIMMAAGLRATQTLRPSLDRFYAGLSDEQRSVVSDLLSRRHRRH